MKVWWIFAAISFVFVVIFILGPKKITYYEFEAQFVQIDEIEVIGNLVGTFVYVEHFGYKEELRTSPYDAGISVRSAADILRSARIISVELKGISDGKIISIWQNPTSFKEPNYYELVERYLISFKYGGLQISPQDYEMNSVIEVCTIKGCEEIDVNLTLESSIKTSWGFSLIDMILSV